MPLLSKSLLRFYLVSALLFAAVFVWAQMTLPDGQIPTHFSAEGKIDGYGTKNSLIWPMLGIVLFAQIVLAVLLQFIHRVPLRFINVHDAWKKKENLDRLRAKIRGLLALMGAVLWIDFATVLFFMVAAARANELRHLWLVGPMLIFTLVAIIAPCIPLLRAPKLLPIKPTVKPLPNPPKA